jgi:hypothetical protein
MLLFTLAGVMLLFTCLLVYFSWKSRNPYPMNTFFHFVIFM